MCMLREVFYIFDEIGECVMSWSVEVWYEVGIEVIFWCGGGILLLCVLYVVWGKVLVFGLEFVWSGIV